MTKLFLGCLLTTFLTVPALAQEEQVIQKKYDHYVGLQVNQLIRQIFNFSDNSPIASNAYSFAYSFNSKSTGVGMNFGIGYNFSESSTSDRFFERENGSSNFVFRVGIERKKEIFRKVLGSIGFDATTNIWTTTSTTMDTNNQGTSVEWENKGKGWGMGPRGTINYCITDRMLIGTEITYYFNSSKSKLKETNRFIEVQFDPFTGQQSTVTRSEEQSNESKSKSFFFNAPTVLFLILKF